MEFKEDEEVKLNFKRGSVWSLGGRLFLSFPLFSYKFLSVAEEEFGKRVWELFYEELKKAAEEHAYFFLDSAPVSKKILEEKPSLEEVFKFVVSLLHVYGLGIPRIEKNELPKGEAAVFLENSPFASEYFEKVGKSSRPVCTYISAVLAGFATAIYGKPIDCVEMKCRAMSVDECEFRVFPESMRLNYEFFRSS